jgi:hypothetical protein
MNSKQTKLETAFREWWLHKARHGMLPSEAFDTFLATLESHDLLVVSTKPPEYFSRPAKSVYAMNLTCGRVHP